MSGSPAKPIITLVADSINPVFKSSDYDLSNPADVQESIDALAKANRVNKAGISQYETVLCKALDDLNASTDMDGFAQFLGAIAGIVGKDVTATLTRLQETDNALKAALALHTALKAVDQANTEPSTVLAEVDTFAKGFLPGGPVDMAIITGVAKTLEDKNAAVKAELGKIKLDQKVATAETSINAMYAAIGDTTVITLASAAPVSTAPTIVPKKELDLSVGGLMERRCAIMDAVESETRSAIAFADAVKYLDDARKGGDSLKKALPGWTIKL